MAWPGRSSCSLSKCRHRKRRPASRSRNCPGTSWRSAPETCNVSSSCFSFLCCLRYRTRSVPFVGECCIVVKEICGRVDRHQQFLLSIESEMPFHCGLGPAEGFDLPLTFFRLGLAFFAAGDASRVLLARIAPAAFLETPSLL